MYHTDKDKYITIGGKSFEYDVFEYLLNRFKEAFSYSSLTIEAAFKELEDLELLLEDEKSQADYDYYQLLPLDEQHKIKDIARQIIVFKGSKFGAFTDTLDGSKKQINQIYSEYFKYFDSYLHYYIRFDQSKKIDKKSTFQSLNHLFINLPKRNVAYSRAYNMQKDNLDAFDYSMKLDNISVVDIININNMVNQSDPDKLEGFKKTNNDILGSSFTPIDKTNVPTEMQRLLAEYKAGFGEEILDPNEPGINGDERMNRFYKLFKREALFHIKFERIHPFNDGNGRTGRILMNHNLLLQRVAPAIITNYMARDYKQYINDYNVDALTQMLVNSSSQQMANWVSMNKVGLSFKKKEINPTNSKLAELDGYEFGKEKNTMQKVFSKNLNHITID